jgi:hypothetical protein
MAEGVEVGVVPLPAGQDPDSAARGMSPKDFQKLLRSRWNIFSSLTILSNNEIPEPETEKSLFDGYLAHSLKPMTHSGRMY